jgi:threonine/homoserine/homoserine lactone efflux protein
MLSYLIQGATYGFAAAVTPGPLSMFLINRAASNGWRRAMPVAFAPLISDGPIAVLILAVLSQVPAGLVFYLRILGGAFILYLAWGAWKAWRSSDSEKPTEMESGSATILKAAAVNWLNPNPYIGWSLIMGPILLSGWREGRENGVIFLSGFYVTLIACMVGMIVMFAAARALGARIRKCLIALSSIALACLGFYQLWLGIGIIGAWRR